MSLRRRIAALALAMALVVQAVAVSSVLAAGGPVAAIGLLPVAMPDTGSVGHGGLRSVAAPGVLGNDLQLGGGFTADLVDDVDHGTLTLNANGGYTYRSESSFVGTDVFRYRIVGGLLGPSNTTTVTITVTNAAPVARPDAYSAVADVEKSIGTPGLLANDDDADGDDLEVDIVSEPSHGNLNEDDDGSFRYKADDDFAGVDTFTYRVTDGLTWSSTVVVRMTVTAAPTAPPAASPTPTPTPPPTATPGSGQTPTPGPTSAPTPTPAPGATVRPTATPGPGATSSPRPGGTPAPGSSPAPSPNPSPTPSGSIDPTAPTIEPSIGPDVTPGPSAGASIAPVIPPAPGTSPRPGTSPAPGTPTGPASPIDRFHVAAAGPGSGLGIDALSVAFDGLEWAVPALVLTVPGLLLILAVLAQTTIGLAFVPVARRWLGGDRRRRA